MQACRGTQLNGTGHIAGRSPFSDPRCDSRSRGPHALPGDPKTMTLPDLPINNAKSDLLDRKRLAEALGHTLTAVDLGTPLATAIYGDWGTGKTSVMRMIEAALPA